MMENNPSTNLLSNSVRIYRAMLGAYPKMFRDKYETQMVQVFRDSIRETYHQNRMFGLIDVWLHTLVDLVITALMERISERSQYMFSPKVTLGGGVASICAGIFWLAFCLMIALPNSSGGEGTIVLALILGIVGLVGLYSRQIEQGRRSGLAGFVLGIVGTGLALVALRSFVTVHPEIDPIGTAPIALRLAIGMAILGTGLVLLGVPSLNANILSRWRGLPLSLGLLHVAHGITLWLVYYVPLSQGRVPWIAFTFGQVVHVVVALLLGLGWLGLGIRLTSDADAEITQSSPLQHGT